MPRKNPSTRWFFRDWESDEALRLCSLAAQGLWMRLLCIMAENDGYLLLGGKHPSLAGVARYLGCTPKEVQKGVSELEENGVFSRDENQVIFNRRMVRENGSNGAEEANVSRAQRTRAHLGARPARPKHGARPPTPRLLFPPKSPQGDLVENLNDKEEKPPRRDAFNHNGVSEHRPAFGPLRDPVEIARELGLPK